MDFGYFTLSDNRYADNPRTANRSSADIAAEALYAEELRMHSAWIGEHRFNSLGVLSCPTWCWPSRHARSHIRLAPAVTVLPLHHPVRVAEQWATLDLLSNGRVDFAAGAATTGANTSRSTSPSPTTSRSSRRAWSWCKSCGAADGASRTTASTIQFDDVALTPKPVQQPLPAYVASFSKPSIELAAPLGLRADRGALRGPP